MRRSEDEEAMKKKLKMNGPCLLTHLLTPLLTQTFFVSFFCFEKMLRGKGKQPSIMCPEADVNDTMLQG